MRRLITLGFVIFVVSSCGVTLESVVQTGLTKKYVNPLIVIPHDIYQAAYFAKNLKKNFEETFKLNNQKVEVLLITVSQDNLSLNSSDSNEILINDAISKDKKDLIIIFKPIKLQYNNGALQSASYQLIGVDIETRKEVWKANFNSSGYFGPSTFAKASAQKIFQKLKDDKILY